MSHSLSKAPSRLSPTTGGFRSASSQRRANRPSSILAAASHATSPLICSARPYPRQHCRSRAVCAAATSALIPGSADGGSEGLAGTAAQSNEVPAVYAEGAGPPLRSWKIAASVLHQLLWSSLRPLLIISAIATFGEQVVGFITFLFLTVLGVPESSWLTFIAGLTGIAAGYTISVYSKAAAYFVMHDLDVAPTPAPRIGFAASIAGFQDDWTRRALAIRSNMPAISTLVWADIRRIVWVAWQGFLTFPVPVLALPKILDLAVIMPALNIEKLDVKDALQRSAALLHTRRLILLRAFLLLAAVFVAVLVALISSLLYFVPELLGTMLPLPLEAGTTSGDVIADFLSGGAFARVFEKGTTVEQGALTLALVISVAFRWAAMSAMQLLAYTCYREFSARGAVPVKPSRIAVAVTGWAQKLRDAAGDLVKKLPGGAVAMEWVRVARERAASLPFWRFLTTEQPPSGPADAVVAARAEAEEKAAAEKRGGAAGGAGGVAKA